MQIKGLHNSLYKLSRYASKHLSKKKIDTPYSHAVEFWQKLKSEGVSDSSCSELVGISRATFYRYKKRIENRQLDKKPRGINRPKWGEKEKQIVLMIRRQNPSYGKFKITVILKRDHAICISESTVGRILRFLMEKKLIKRSASASRARRKRTFKQHAQPWTYKDYETMKMGERVQIDHMTVNKYGTAFKHFQAWDRRSKFVAANVFSNANSRSAKRFLEEFLKSAPFPIHSIQVDGGSEFMADFEQACADLQIPLIVLPPSKPQYNGGVERTNRTLREEFYDTNQVQSDNVGGLRLELKNVLEKHNNYRPHNALQGMTLMEHITQYSSTEATA